MAEAVRQKKLAVCCSTSRSPGNALIALLRDYAARQLLLTGHAQS